MVALTSEHEPDYVVFGPCLARRVLCVPEAARLCATEFLRPGSLLPERT